jgi:hypothetical protein
MATEGHLNTDREIWRERPDDFYADSIHVTKEGFIGINCGGYVYVKPVGEWHKLAGGKEAMQPAREPSSKEQIAREAFERWHQGGSSDSAGAVLWRSGYMSAVVDGRRPEISSPDVPLRSLLVRVINEWVNGRRVLDGIRRDLALEISEALNADETTTGHPVVACIYRDGCRKFPTCMHEARCCGRIAVKTSPDVPPSSNERANPEMDLSWQAFLGNQTTRLEGREYEVARRAYVASWYASRAYAARSRDETPAEPEDDPANAEIIAKLKAAFGGDPDPRILGAAMCKLADGAIAPNGVAILTNKECDAMGKEIRRLNRAARPESQVKTSAALPTVVPDSVLEKAENPRGCGQ